MNKKNKCVTALLTTALLTYGFALTTNEESLTQEPNSPPEVLSEATPLLGSKTLYLVSSEEMKTDIPEQDSAPPEEVTPPPDPEESEPVPATSPQQATTLTQTQADTGEVLPTVSLTETTSENSITTEDVSEFTINIPEAGTMNGIDYGTIQTIQPDVTKPSYTEEQLTDPTQKPDGTPVNSPTMTQTWEPPTTQTTSQADDVYWQIQNDTYEFHGDEIIYTEHSIIHVTYPPENLEPVYFLGFGWIEPSSEPTIRVEVLDMEESGIKVGTMGGG